MIALPVLLTPLMLAAQPVDIQIPDRSYDHQRQVGTFKGDSAKGMQLAGTYTTSGERAAGMRDRD